MNKRSLVLFVLCISIFLVPTVQADELVVKEENGIKYAGEGWSTEYNGLKVVYFSGTPEEIGQQQSLFILNDDTEGQIAFYNNLKQRMETGNNVVDGFYNLYTNHQIIPTLKRHIPEEYLQEFRGMEKGVKGEAKVLDANDFIFANSFQDIGLAMGCSVFSAWGDTTQSGELIVGRNMDKKEYLGIAKYQYLAFYNPAKGHKFVTLNYPGHAGLMQGMNEQGLVIAMSYANTKKPETSIDGLPFVLMFRQVLQYSANLEEAIESVKNTPRTIGLNITLASAKDNRAVVLETSANRFYLREAENYIYATNHFRSEYMKKHGNGKFRVHSYMRDERFEELIAQYSGDLNYQDMVKIMRDKFDPDSRRGKGLVAGIENAGTMASLVFRPDKLQIYPSNLSGMPAPEGEYLGFDCKKIWEEGKPSPPFEIIDEPEPTTYSKNWLKMREAENAYFNRNGDKVKELLTSVLQDMPEAETPLVMMGETYIKLREFDKGISLLEKVTELPETAYSNNLLRAYFWLGLTYDLFLDEREKAVGYYQKAVDLKIPGLLEEENNQLKILARLGLKYGLTTDEKGNVIPDK